ncbi:MAG TPA: hypothetical protein V6C97_25580 [Oculatellaceae cyanobacterium]
MTASEIINKCRKSRCTAPHLLSLAFLLLAVFHAPQPAWAKKFVRVLPVDGTWWFVDSKNRTFISRGVDSVNINQDYIGHSKECPYESNAIARYQTAESWQKAAGDRLLLLNFNTLGAWSDSKVAVESTGKKKQLYYTVILHAADSFDNWNHLGMCDFFDPKFAISTKALAEKICAPLKDDEKLIGYFGDNELPWVSAGNPLLLQYLNFDAEAPGRRAAMAFLQRHYPSFIDFNRIWNTQCHSWTELDEAKNITAPAGNREIKERFEKDCEDFASLAASRYFDIIDLSIKVADPNHLNLGCRFSVYPGAPILRACGSHVDVISFNCYEPDPRKTIRKYASVGKPLLIGEFSFRSQDSGLPNSKGAGPIVQTQAIRGEWYESYVKNALSCPNIVGYHWFEHIDQPKEGRFDGENSNYGIANIHDEPYAELTHVMKQINLEAESLHDKAGDY